MKIVLVNPDIPWNAGNIGRTCVATGTELIFTGRLGFRLDSKEIRRSGLDYWQFLKYSVYPNFDDFLKTVPENSSMPVLEYFIDNTARYKNYNVVPDEEITLLTAAKTVSYIAGVYTEIEVAKEGLGLSYSGDNGRLRREIPGLKFTDFETAVSRLYDYYRVNKDMIKEEKLLSDK